MARKINSRPQRAIYPTVVGAGKTEKFYFSHLKDLYNLNIQIQSRFFGNENFPTLEKRVENVLSNEGKAIVVFDVDVSSWDENVKSQYDRFKNKYAGNPNVIICDSLPSIEYWFLLHFMLTDKHFPTSKSIEKELKKHIPAFNKSEDFLQNTKWVADLCANGKLPTAYKRAKASNEFAQSHTNVWKALDATGIEF